MRTGCCDHGRRLLVDTSLVGVQNTECLVGNEERFRVVVPGVLVVIRLEEERRVSNSEQTETSE